MKSHRTTNLLALAALFAFASSFLACAKPHAKEMGNKNIEIKGWGTADDPDGDCAFFVSKEALLINVPGSKHPHDLAAEVGTMNAPRVLKTVNGDFTVEVQVNGRFVPGQKSTMSSRVGYNGAGLVVMADPRNVVCLARAVMNHPDNAQRSYANFEMRVGGELERIGDARVHPLPFKGPVFLRLERRGQKISGSVSTDGKEWDQLKPKELPMNWPKKLQVGIVAISTSTEEFDPRYSQFSIAK